MASGGVSVSDTYTPGPQPPQAGGFSLAENAPQPMVTGNLMDPMGMLAQMMPPPPEKRFDCKIKRCIKSGRLLVNVVPLEDYEGDASSTQLDEDGANFAGDKTRITRGKLKLRYKDKKDIIDELPAYSEIASAGLQKQARDNDFWGQRIAPQDKDSELVEIRESYVLVDYDGDGIQEWRQVVTGGIMGQRHILSNEEWGGLLPYTDICPNPQPHRWRGRSLFDDLYDIQRVKTVLMRQTLDNLYLTNNPRQGADESKILNKEAVVNQELGGTIWTKGDPNGALVPIVTPFVGKDTFPVLEYMDMVASKRTGVSRESAGLDPDALQNQTATAVQEQKSAQSTKIETFARNIAECGGLKRLFKCLLRLFCENQRQARTIRLRGKWVEIDPRGWDANMDCSINVGLGTGSKDRDMAMLQGVLMLQQQIIMGLQDPFNPILNVGHVLEVGRKLAEQSGLKQPEQYFPEFTQEQVAQTRQQMQQNPPPNPEQMKAQAQMQIEQAKLQANMQQKQLEMQQAQSQAAMDFQREQQADQRKAEIESVQMQADIATNREKVAADMQIAREKFEFDKQLALIEHQAKMQEMQMQAKFKERENQTKLVTMKMTAVNDRAKHEMEMENEGIAPYDSRVVESERMDKTDAMVAMIQELAERTKELAEQANAPTEIIRDPKTNRIVGSRKGKRTQTVQRDENGRATGVH
jgi:hypothetical protein